MKPMPESKSETRMQKLGQSRRLILLAAAGLVYLVCEVFSPIVGFDFIDYDVPGQVIDNPHIQDLSGENLKHIFTSPCITSYYPIRTLSFAVDYQLWGLNPGGFKLTNGLIHLTNVLLVFWLILRIFRHQGAAMLPNTWRDVCVAAFAAGILALHPVVVEPVAWVAGREELLMMLGTVGCIHFHLTARRLDENGSRTRSRVACHACAALCCAAACLSNAVAAVIPLLIVAWDLLTLTGPKFWKILRGTLALWVIAVATVTIKKLGSESELIANAPSLFSAQRLTCVLNVYWLNLKTYLWPTGLVANYPRVTRQSFVDSGVILGGIAVGLTCLILLALRQRKTTLLGLVWFGLALGPGSQIIPHHVHRADRFLYLPLLGLVVAVAMELRPLVRALKAPANVAGIIVAGGLGLFLLDIMSVSQVRTWRNTASMWENCLRVYPGNPTAHGGLAENLAEAGHFDRAIRHYYSALRIDPDDLETLKDFALLLATCRQEELRDYDLAVRLARRARELADPPDPAAVMVLAEVYAQAGRSEMVVAMTEEAIQLAQTAGNMELAGDLRRRLKQYMAGTDVSSPAKVGEAAETR